MVLSSRSLADTDATVYSQFLHLTCGDDDRPHRTYLAKWHGYGSDAGGYYSDPPLILSLQDLYGTKDQIEVRMRILLAAAYVSRFFRSRLRDHNYNRLTDAWLWDPYSKYSGRAVLPPAQGVIRDMFDDSRIGPADRNDNLQRYSYALFPFSHISNALNITILEPDYIR